MKCLVLLGCSVLLICAQGAFAAGVVQAADGMGLGCESIEDYNRSKVSAYRVVSSTVSLRQQNKHKELVIRARIEAAQCRKLGKNRFEWRQVNPLDRFQFEHEHYNFDTGQFTTKKIIIEPKDVQMLAIDNSYNLLGEGRVTGSLTKGFYSPISIPMETLVSDEQSALIESGNLQRFRVGIFLKSKFRHIVEGESTAYEESGASAMFYVSFAINKVNGEYRLQ
ncbi:hypothetical protein IMCC1989_2702 [gamma proteobacterium IMCC1989]|nr:hypothetical protein IMCC1989_2702 [gamma proteobacterium IMCC1989]